ncbi:hypothetical protein [Amycolatopsis alba]|uniref:Uncharacterized protein n=1 Tax=Amycolatopsis alba DSM 44262 TaxID=1125972 RepID=A0A229RAT2_AMYAL|nr:hypothetical protein [Amycolatopsis alba]OXM43757.1 hypothetical protein CFP75_37215 [Amycolatopsis alba DSM 44262]
MNSDQQECDLPAGEIGRARSAVLGLRSSRGVKTRLAGHGIRRPEPVADEPSKPYSPPSFLGMFDLPADASERVKAVVRGQEVA